MDGGVALASTFAASKRTRLGGPFVALPDAVRAGAAEDPHVLRWRLDLFYALGNFAVPAGSGDQETGPPFRRSCDCRATGPGSSACSISGTENIACPYQIRIGEHDWLLTRILPGNGVKRVSVGCRDATVIGRGIALDIDEAVDRFAKRLDRGYVGHLRPRHVGGDQGIAIDAGVHDDLLRSINRDLVN